MDTVDAVHQGDADIAAVGAVLADPGRCAMMLALGDGRALPASRLAAEAGVAAATASHHLRILRDAGLLAVERHGRHRYYRLAGPDVGRLVETLTVLAPPRPVRSLREGTAAHALRCARTCYDHLAGRLGVALMTALVERGLLSAADGSLGPGHSGRDGRVGYGHDVDYRLTPQGHDLLAGFGLALPPRGPVVRYCVDWSEQRHHLAGGLGRGLWLRMLELGWLRRASGSRAVRVTESGTTGLAETFGVLPTAGPISAAAVAPRPPGSAAGPAQRARR